MSKTTQRDHTERWLVALLVLVAGVFSVLIPQVFWSAANFQSIASQIPVVGILTLAMAITMLTGGINLSIIATANASALVMAWVCTHLEPTFSSLIVMLLAGGGCLGGGDHQWGAYLGGSGIPNFGDTGHHDLAQRDQCADLQRLGDF